VSGAVSEGPAATSRRARARTRRRPSGEPPPLPHEPDARWWLWFGAIVLFIGVVIAVFLNHSDPFKDVGNTILRWFAQHEGDGLVSVAKALNVLTNVGVVMAARVGVLIVLVVFVRWRHLVISLAAYVVTDFVVVVVAQNVPRPAPDVPPLVPVSTFAFPSRAVASFAITLFVAVAALLPQGRRRVVGWWAGAALTALVVLARLVLAADYPVDAVYAGLLAFAVAIVAFRVFAPDESFPVSYRRGGNAAHLDLTGPRSEAIKTAVRDQLGLDVAGVEPFGLAGSGGSSPLRMTLGDGSLLFGKIYAVSHARADRWYRIGRTILYGTLEDETPFGTPRRLAEYEDYSLRFLADNGVRVATTWGPVELTPNREYMLVTQFFTNAKNLGESDIDDAIIDEGVALVRTFWDIGVSHRDIKPANMLVGEGHLQLVDVSGLEVRPSPWRQAVDLANMMMTLALQSDPDRVYARATSAFTPDDLGEAFASAVGLAIPTELQSRLKADPRPILDRFKELAPPHAKVSIQSWSARRIGLTAVAVIATVALAGLFVASLAAGLR
jgi:membrane-associated phospholipid phosphatase